MEKYLKRFLFFDLFILFLQFILGVIFFLSIKFEINFLEHLSQILLFTGEDKTILFINPPFLSLLYSAILFFKEKIYQNHYVITFIVISLLNFIGVYFLGWLVFMATFFYGSYYVAGEY